MLWLLLLIHSHVVYTAQPSAPSPIPAPLRKLPWGQLNFLHTTDTHGWHAGHLQEPQYSADWGDYISFAHHLRQRANQDGSGLITIDTGDRVEGNGLYDASKPKGKYTSDIIKHQQIDIIVSGNHELYQANTSIAEYETTVPNFKNSYLASNINIRIDGELVPLAQRFKKFTRNGIRILAFGFLFNFHGNADNTVVQDVQETIKEQWFQDAIRQKVDLFIIAGHAPVRNGIEFDAIYKAIRDVQWDTPMAFFGGHTHIRDYRKWDKKAYGIESGRYMETIGFMSISGLSAKAKIAADESSDTVDISASPTYQRLYIDNNLYSLQSHANVRNFDTDLGRNVSAQIAQARKSLDLDKTFGCAPHDLWLNRAPYPSKESLLVWLEQVLRDTFNGTSMVITNTGAIRFDIFKGPFTIDSTFLVSPFISGFHKLKDVPYSAASQVLRLLNNEGPILASLDTNRTLHDLTPHLPVPSLQVRSVEVTHQSVLSDEKLIPGYTTSDDAGSDGDDTIHKEIQFYNVPNCIAANVGFDPEQFRTTAVPETVDLAYNEFIETWVLLALRYLGVKYEKEDAISEGGTLTKIISDWVQTHWQCKD